MLTRTALLATVFSASAVVATSLHGHLEMKRALEARQSSGSGSGNDDDDDNTNATACLTAVISLLSSVPTPPPALISAFTSANIDDACSFTPPPSLAAPYSSYVSAVSSWYGANGDRVSSALKDCPGVGDSLDNLDATCGAGTSSTRSSGGVRSSASRSIGGGDVSTTVTRSIGGGDVSTTVTRSIGGGDVSATVTRSIGGGDSSDTAETTGTITTGGPGVQTTGLGAGAVSTTSSRTGGAGPQQTGFAGAALAAVGFLGVVAAL